MGKAFLGKQAKLIVTKHLSEDIEAENVANNLSDYNELDYLRSILYELKNIAGNTEHKLLFHLIAMAEIEATDILEKISSETRKRT